MGMRKNNETLPDAWKHGQVTKERFILIAAMAAIINK
jgi:hypothetical protein